MIPIQFLDFTVVSNTQRILNNISMQITAGDSVALVGGSGTGKTTLALSLLGHIAPELRVATGTVRVGDINPLQLRGTALRALRRRIAYVDQDPGAALPSRYTIRKIINERVQLSTHHDTPELSDKQLLKLLASFDLNTIPNILSLTPKELSGGQRRRVAVAAGLATNPELLIIDEPTAGVDRDTATLMIETLQTTCAHIGATTIVITHDPIVADALASRVVNLSENNEPSTVSLPQENKPLIIQKSPLLKIKSLNLTVHPGECIGLTGPSGSGKTTTMRAILGLTKRCTFPIDLHTTSFGWAPQEAELALNPSVSIARQLRRTGAAKPQIESLLDELDLPPFLARTHRSLRPDDLSGGQRQRVNVARALLSSPKLLLCDEPTSSLDSHSAQLVIAAIRKYCNLGAGALIVSHNEDVLAACDRVSTLMPSS